MPRTWPTYRKTTRGANRQREKVIQMAVKRWIDRELPHVKDYFNDWASGKYFENPALSKERAALSSGRGWSDLTIPYPMTHTMPDGSQKTYHGFFMEEKKEDVTIYKRDGQLVASEQIQIEAAFLKRMNDLGYYACFGVGLDGGTIDDSHAIPVGSCLMQLRHYFHYSEPPENESLF